MELEYRDIDRRIWEEELASWVPEKVFDAHSHIMRAENCLLEEDDPIAPRPKYVDEWEVIDLARVRRWDSALLPGRQPEHLLIACPWAKADWEGQMKFLASEVPDDTLTRAEMLLAPTMKPEWVAAQVEQYGFVGLKPYRTLTDDPVNCRITDMAPEQLLEVADDKGLIITMHLAKERALADPENIDDLQRLSPKYPNIRWVLAHCARCFAPWAIRESIDHIRDLPNVWMDTAAVCASEVFDIVLDKFPANRIMHGSDTFAGWERGKYVWWGYTWEHMFEGTLTTAHADSRATFVLYEQLRALGHALHLHNWDKHQIQALFWDNAVKLIHGKSGA